ncbi:MAG: hypothetical protein K0R61_524 [Microvirga sp.]|jgi:hypothetical protein|nr:hypothetical protein [Rhodospirillales bacterium]MDF2970074.1 hypothetical protein [Microvirga sp.]
MGDFRAGSNPNRLLPARWALRVSSRRVEGRYRSDRWRSVKVLNPPCIPAAHLRQPKPLDRVRVAPVRSSVMSKNKGMSRRAMLSFVWLPAGSEIA